MLMLKGQPIQWSKFIKIILFDSSKEGKNDFKVHLIGTPFGQCIGRLFTLLLCAYLLPVDRTITRVRKSQKVMLVGRENWQAEFWVKWVVMS